MKDHSFVERDLEMLEALCPIKQVSGYIPDYSEIGDVLIDLGWEPVPATIGWRYEDGHRILNDDKMRFQIGVDLAK